jgi:hypothetical protein
MGDSCRGSPMSTNEALEPDRYLRGCTVTNTSFELFWSGQPIEQGTIPQRNKLGRFNAIASLINHYSVELNKAIHDGIDQSLTKYPSI